MVKKGPCFHCGIESTPLWRNGPPEKPVLCNACGSRFRLWATLDNYTPRHAQLHDSPTDHETINTTNTTPTTNNINNNDSPKHHFTLDSIISPQGKLNPSLWNCSAVPSKKRTTVVHKKLTPMQKFKRQMASWWKQEIRKKKEEEEEEVLIMHKVNNLIVPSNEIGLGSMPSPTTPII